VITIASSREKKSDPVITSPRQADKIERSRDQVVYAQEHCHHMKYCVPTIDVILSLEILEELGRRVIENNHGCVAF
jgi:hypothetical protein